MGFLRGEFNPAASPQMGPRASVNPGVIRGQICWLRFLHFNSQFPNPLCVFAVLCRKTLHFWQNFLRAHLSFGVRCSMLDVRCFVFLEFFAVILSPFLVAALPRCAFAVLCRKTLHYWQNFLRARKTPFASRVPILSPPSSSSLSSFASVRFPFPLRCSAFDVGCSMFR